MVFYTDLEKIIETDQFAQNRFTSDNITGIVQIEKANGDVVEIVPSINDKYKRIFEGSAWALIKHYKNGEYPDRTCWAS